MTDTAVTADERDVLSAPDIDDNVPSPPSLPLLPTLPSLPTAGSAPAPAVAPVAPRLADVAIPSLPEGEMPVLPPAAPAAPHSAVEIPEQLVAEVVAGEPEPRRHPMAHMMPEKSKPNEASIRAAELRAARKAKARKIKIIVAVVSIALTALVGPPLMKWLVNAINEAGSTKSDETEQPVEQSIDDLVDSPAAGIEAIDDAKQLVGDTTP